MKQKAASTGTGIQLVTAFVLVLNAILYVGALRDLASLPVAVCLSAVALACYLFWAPVTYELTPEGLTVIFRASRKTFGPVIGCSRVNQRLGISLRLWGNGGLFSGAGIFWSRGLGVFRAYITRSRHSDWVLVETGRGKVVISPENVDSFLEGCRDCEPALT